MPILSRPPRHRPPTISTRDATEVSNMWKPEVEHNEDITVELRESDPFRPSIATIIDGFGSSAKPFTEGLKVEILGVYDDPTRPAKRAVVIKVIDERAVSTVFGAVACVTPDRLRLEG